MVDILIERRGAIAGREYVVVLEAPPVAYAAPEIVRDWFEPHECPACGHSHWHPGRHVRVDRERRIVTFGTEGFGEGVVSYRVGEIPPEREPVGLGSLTAEVVGPPEVVRLTRVDGER